MTIKNLRRIMTA